MSKNWVKDIQKMHDHYGVYESISTMTDEQLESFLRFRVKFLTEELTELVYAKNPDDVVDALIDLCVVAIGTLDLFNVDPYTAWNRVHKANMKKEVGIKESRPNPLGLPDLVKPSNWKAPDHWDNIGLLSCVRKLNA